MKKFSTIIIITIGMGLGYGAFGKESSSLNYLNKVFYHHGKLADRIACYFSKEPLCNYIPETAQTKEGWQTAKFFFPAALVGTPECKSMITALNEAQPDHYRISLKTVSTPIKGLLLNMEFDPHYVGLEYETFTSIQQQQGVVFKIYFKPLLQELNAKATPLHHCAEHKKPRVVLDFGHGGEDDGKIGWAGLKEKDINLSVGMKVAQLLREEGVVVFLTRNSDRFVPLEDRTTFANRLSKADLFVSIHANGAPSAAASGIETFCSDPSLFSKGISLGLESIERNLIVQSDTQRWKQSMELAQSVHTHAVQAARTIHPEVIDRKLKHSITQVLLGTDMPAALIEIGFLSHEREAQWLTTSAYQETLALGICQGITSFLAQAYA
jgi:N-acetylmuramoyl-L-alanine amidase